MSNLEIRDGKFYIDGVQFYPHTKESTAYAKERYPNCLFEVSEVTGECMDDDTVTYEQYKALNTMPHPQFAALLLTLLNAGWSLTCSITEVPGDQYEARIRVEDQRGTSAAFRSTARHEMPGDALYAALAMIFTFISDREISKKR